MLLCTAEDAAVRRVAALRIRLPEELAQSAKRAYQEVENADPNDASAHYSRKLGKLQRGWRTPGKVPVSLVIYIDATYIKKGIPIRPIYCKCHNIAYDIAYHIVHDIVYDFNWFMLFNSFLCFSPPVGCINDDRTVMSKAFAWRPLALLPILKASACAKTDKDWLVHRRLELYHRSMDHVIADLNELCSKEIYLRFADDRIRLSRAFLHVLVLDGAKVAAATMCDTRQCPVCTCTHQELDKTDKAYP